jgi:hypothetical protein
MTSFKGSTSSSMILAPIPVSPRCSEFFTGYEKKNSTDE